jgi:hypothetical protein
MTHKSTHLATVALCWLTLLVAAASATAATATFSASFEAERHAEWDQPRGVDVIDCHGQHYYAADGEDTATIKTRRPFKVTVTRIGTACTWGPSRRSRPRSIAPHCSVAASGRS